MPDSDDEREDVVPMESGPSKDEEEEEGGSDENEEDQDDEADEDGEDEDSDSESEEDDSDSDDESESDEEEDPDGLSKYERLRMERIKRNQERLAQLGLQGKDGEGVLGKKPPKQRRNRKPQIPVEQRERLSRKTKAKEVDYTGELNLKMLLDADKEEKRKAKLAKKKANKQHKAKSHDERVPIWIYKEFQRIKSTRKDNLKRAKRHLRNSTREVKYWQKELDFISHREQQKYGREINQQKLEQERQLLGGKTQHEIFQELESRMPELEQVVAQYDAAQMSVEERQRQQLLVVEEWNKKQALDRKMSMIDALETFPKSFNDAMSTLNAQLWQRSPKDPPPPRKSRRNMTEEEEAALKAEQGNKKKKAKTNSNSAAAAGPSSPSQQDWSTLAASLAAAAARDAKSQMASLENAAAAAKSDPNEEPKQRKKRPKDARNVGGWVSPIFSLQLDRSWLERTKPLKKVSVVPPAAQPKGTGMPVFDLNSYTAQAGDVVLFYPSAYKDYLEVNPDTLGSRLRNLLRVPLWLRARRQLGRLNGGTGSAEDQKDLWFTEEWINSLAGKKGDPTVGGGDDDEVTLGDYPILCQVIRTHAEFPPDPYSKEKSISKTGKETTIAWAQPAASKVASVSGKQKANRPQIRHAVSLKPLTTVIPPHLLRRMQHAPPPAAAGRGASQWVPPTAETLAIPPNFTVLTCPTYSPLEPFLIPFCYAYTTFHSLSMSESVFVRRAENEDYHRDDSKTKLAGRNAIVRGKGRVVGFASAPEVPMMSQVEPWQQNGHHNTRGGGALVDMNELNPMMGVEDPLHGMNMEFGDPLGEDPFGLGDDPLGALGELPDDAMDWQHQPGHQQQPLQQQPMVSRSLRIEDRRDELEAILASLQSGDALATSLTSGSSKGSLPLREGGIIVDFLKIILSGMKNKTANGSVPQAAAASSSTSLLMDFIHSTLPIRNGVSVKLDANRRQSHRTCPWHLVPFQPNEYVRNTIQDGFLGTLDNAMREKAVMGLEDLIDNHQPNSQLFVPMITEQVAPGYYMAVPVAMFFDRIFARLKANAAGVCYYTSTDSIIMDLTAISENCMLFNSPESELVTICNNLITECKKFVVDISKTASESSAKTDTIVTSTKKRSNLVIPEDLNAPYKAKLYREWFQQISPDGSREGSKSSARQWLPQCGDSVVYSRALHKDFITGHMESLAEIQCQLPGFQTEEGESELSNEDLQATIMSKWLKGTVVSVRTSFPLAQVGKSKDSFSKPSPILVVELQLNYSWCQDTIIVFWRPCILPTENANSCQTCGLSFDSFLQPESSAPDNVLDSDSSPMEVPGALSQDVTTSMKKCFDFLMRRSLVDCPPNFVPVQDALAMAERNVAIHPGGRSLPSFEDFLLPSDPGKKKQTHTRGVKKPDDPFAISKLAESGFLPPWSDEALQDQMKQEGKRDKNVPRHEALTPFPSLCIELIRLRLSTGYYRNVLAIVNDLSEAYIAAVLYILSGPASRKMNRVSIRKIARYLASSQGTPKMQKLYYKRQNKKNIGGNESGSSNSKKQESNDQSFSQEEIMLVTRIAHIRSFYATAIVFATRATSVERLFCLKVYPVPQPPDLPSIDPIQQGSNDYNEEQLQGLSKIRWIIQAIGRDPCHNRFNIVQSKRYNLKISCGGQVIGESGDLQAMADGLTYFRPSYALAQLPEGLSVRLRFRVGDEYIYGEGRRVSNSMPNQMASVGWPMPHAASDTISSANIRCTIPLEFQQFERNHDLTRAIFGFPQRRFPCVRCQFRGASTFMCRVKRAHSNYDFSILEHFQGTSGVDSLFLPWKSEEDSTEEEKSEDDDDDEGLPTKDLEEEAKKAEATREKRAKEARENLLKAQDAQRKAEYLQIQADRLNELETKLSTEFIELYFPIDKGDNHYELCVHCGVPGDLLLCEGCPNVAHAKCLGLETIPDGDWFCSKCVEDKGLSGQFQPTSSGSGNPAAAATVKGSDDNDAMEEESPKAVTDSLDEKIPAAVTAATGNEAASDPTNDSKPPADPSLSIDAATKPPEAPKKPSIPPEITDEEFETQDEELGAVIEALSSQHEQPKPKPKPKEPPVEAEPLEEDAKTPRRRGRPSKKKAKSYSGDADAIEALSANARSFLESIEITTGEDFLAAQTTQLGNDLIKWRKKQKMPPLKGGGHIATISGWKTIVRNAGGVEYLSDDSEEFAEVLPQSKPRSLASIEKRQANAVLPPRQRQAPKRPGRQKAPRSDNPIENLPTQGQNFCAYLKIVDAEEFLSQRSATLAESLVKFRRKEKLSTLAGSGPSAYVAMWKTQLRREVAFQKSVEEERTAKRKKVKRGSKVQDVEVAPEAKRLRAGKSPGRGSGKSPGQGSAKKSSKESKGDDQNISFNVLEETQKLAEDEEPPTPGRRRRVRTNRYAPPK